jgi:hypothetical protein
LREAAGGTLLAALPAVRDLAAIALLAIACGGGDPGTDSDAGAVDGAVELGQGSPPASDLVVNEVSPKEKGVPDWVEILNRGDTAVDLCGYFLTDLADRLDHFVDLGGALPPDPCTPRPLAPGERLVIFADDSSEPDHAPFQLAGADEVHLLTTQGIEVDGLLYLYPEAPDGWALARVPDGEGRFFARPATMGQPNPEAP